MKLQMKASYNLLQMKARIDEKLQVEAWQIEDLRELSTHELFSKLSSVGLALDEEAFILYSENYSTPEDLSFSLWEKEDNKDKIFLLIFELWRRLLPEKQSLSIFCDELDYRIYLYEEDPSSHNSMIQNSLIRLEEILEESSDEGLDPKMFFYQLDPFCAHDMEAFLYDYMATQIDVGNNSYAVELLDVFYPSLTDVFWFDLLRVRLLVKSDPHEANIIIREILKGTQKHPDLDLILEVACFLVAHGDPHLFQQCVKQAFELIKTEEDFQELIAIVTDYYRCLDKEKEEKAFQALLDKRSHLDSQASIDKREKDVSAFADSLSQLIDLSPIMREKRGK